MWGKAQTIASLFDGNADAYTAFDPSVVITRRSRYTAVSGWFDIPGPSESQHRSITTAGIGVVADGAHDSAANPEGQDFAANSLRRLGSAHGIRCSVVTQPGRHDWPFAAQAFATALPWLAGRLGTPGVSRLALPGLTPEAVSPPRPSAAMPSAQAAGK
jgi:S-formylglutathione hydrolase FrmB